MKKKLIFILLILPGFITFSQTTVMTNVNSLYDQYILEKSKEEAIDVNRLAKVAGTPYLSDEFAEGEVIINDSIRYENVPLRYNIFADKMEFIDAQGRILEVNTSINRFNFLFDDRNFKLVQYHDGTRMRRGMLEVLVDGETRLYRKYTVDIQAGTPPMGYQAAKPDRFIRKRDQFLVATEDNVPVLLTSRRNLIRKLEAVNPEINQYTRKNRVNINSEQSLIGLIEYANKPED